jgi:hypothetical protein
MAMNNSSLQRGRVCCRESSLHDSGITSRNGLSDSSNRVAYRAVHEHDRGSGGHWGVCGDRYNSVDSGVVVVCARKSGGLENDQLSTKD